MTWQERVDRLWGCFDDHGPAEFLAKMQALIAERPAHDAPALFEHACAQDSVGHGDEAAPLYRRALSAGLTGLRRRRAVIQLASTLRNLGQAEQSVELLSRERNAGSDELDDAVLAFLALALVDLGREKEAVALALTALSHHLPRYNRSLANYAAALAD